MKHLVIYGVCTENEGMKPDRHSANNHSSDRSSGQPVSYGFAPGRFDMDRMKEALASPTIMAPRGMSMEEIRRFIISGGKHR